MRTKLLFLILLLQASAASAQITYSWVNQIGGFSGQDCKTVSIDPFNNMVVGGSSFGNTEFTDASGTQTTSGFGDYDIYVEKMDPGGKVLWARQLGGAGFEILESIATDPMGNIYLTGYFNDTLRLVGVDTLNSDPDNWDIFLIKLDPNGQALWAHAFGGAFKDEGHAVATDYIGDVYVTGFFKDTVDFDPGPAEFPLVSNSSSGDAMFVLKLDGNGNLKWVKHMTSGTDQGYCVGNALAIKNNDLYIGGYFGGKVDFNPNAGVKQLTAQFDDGFVQKLTLQGNLQWVLPVAGSTTERVLAITVDDSDNVLSCGYFSGSIDLDPGGGTTIFNSAGNHDAFVQKLNASGNFVFGKKVGAGSQDQAWGITTDRLGNVYIAGKFGETVDFDPGPMVQNLGTYGFSDAFVLKLDKNGNFANVARVGGIHFDYGNAIALDQDEAIITVGTFSKTADFDPGPDTLSVLASGFDGYVLKMLTPWDYTGVVYHDLNENNQRDAGEPGLPGVLVEAVDRLAYASTDDEGEYHLYYNLEGDKLRVIPKRPYWEINPPLIPMDTTQSGHITAVVIPVVPDVCIFITEERAFVPGFPTWFQVQVSNVGTVPVYNLPVVLRIGEEPADDTFTFVEANITPDSQTDDAFHWMIDVLDVEQTITYRVLFHTSETTPLGAEFSFSARVELETDVDQSNNTRRFENQIFGSYDPNDKQVLPRIASSAAVDTLSLNYLIRFQNTGNFPATFVVLRDTLSTDLDIATLEILGASHPFTWRMYGNRILEFRFDNINLPDSTSNEPESHGFAAFSIEPGKGLSSGDNIVNRAGIYFDFNAPVITNNAVFEVSDFVKTSEPARQAWLDFGLSPNPVAANSPIVLHLPEKLKEAAQVTIRDVAGRVLKQWKNPAGQTQITVPGLPAGSYFIQVHAGQRLGGKILTVGN